MKKVLLVSATLALMVGAANAGSLPVKAPPPPPAPAWSWTGWYIGAHVGGMSDTATFDDPYGPSIFGDDVTTPGFLGGGQIGYNWQVPSSRWVFGLEGDISALGADGTDTCLAFSDLFVSANCHVHPQVSGTFTGRIGYAAGPEGHTLLYGKAGGAWLDEDVDITTNRFRLPATSTNRTTWGWTAGAGVEQALTPAWSLRLEYDYLHFGSFGVATPPGVVLRPGVAFFETSPTRTNVTQNVHEVILGVNYKFNANPWATWNAGPVHPSPYPVKAPLYKAPAVSWQPGWEFELGVRYAHGWGRFQKDLAPPSLVSRLTYADMGTNAGELFGRIDSPNSIVLKGLIGVGVGGTGHMNDEDWGLAAVGRAGLAYSNELLPTVHDDINYGLIDVGYDVLRASDYKIAPFVGYTRFKSDMSAFGCTSIAARLCVPAYPSTLANITEDGLWQGLRVGAAGDVMLSPRVKLSADVAYLPYAQFTSVDHHFFLNTGILNSFFPDTGTGHGVQLEGLLAYYLTPHFSVGIGGRFWSMWTNSGHYSQTVVIPSAGEVVGSSGRFPAQFKSEQMALFVQAAYEFGRP